MREAMRRLELHHPVSVEGYDVFRLQNPNRSRMGSVELIFGPEGIVIMGDLCPGYHGVISSFGYGLKWFSGRLSEDYLCEKFLRRCWTKERALDELKMMVRQAEDPREGFLNGWLLECPSENTDMYFESEVGEIEIDGHVYDETCWEVASWRAKVEVPCSICGGTAMVQSEELARLRELVDDPMWEDARELYELLGDLNEYMCDDGVPGYGYSYAEAGWLAATQQAFAEKYAQMIFVIG